MSKKLTSSKSRKGIRSVAQRTIERAAAQRTIGRAAAQRAIERAALADPDAQPLTVADLKRMRRTPQTKIIRRALGVTQEEFAARYHIPLGTLRDWEQGRATPDRPTQAYLTVIARNPQQVRQALEG